MRHLSVSFHIFVAIGPRDATAVRLKLGHYISWPGDIGSDANCILEIWCNAVYNPQLQIRNGS